MDDNKLSDAAHEAYVAEQWEEAKIGLYAVGIITLFVAAGGFYMWWNW